MFDARTSTWLADVLGAPVTRVRSLTFGITSELDLIEAGGERFVLRRYSDADVVERGRDIADDEAAILTAARAVLGDLVPRPVAAAPYGSAAGGPVLVMSYLEGAPRIVGLDPQRLVEPLIRLHRADVTTTLPPFHHWYDPARARVPPWTSHADTWARIVSLAGRSQPASRHAFIHRDYHPGNLLWRGDALTGIVDWAFGCWGPPAAEIAHARANLALVEGCAAADRFLSEYAGADPAYAHDPWWDAAELLTWDDDFSGVMAFNAFGAGLDVDVVRSRADEYARSVVAASVREEG